MIDLPPDLPVRRLPRFSPSGRRARPAVVLCSVILSLAACSRGGRERPPGESESVVEQPGPGPQRPLETEQASEGIDEPAEEGAPPGRWKPARWQPARWQIDPSADPAEKLRALEAIGYAAGTRTAGDRMGVTVHLPDRVQPGLNLYVSGHGPEAVLIDMAGNELHRWRYPFELAVPEAEVNELERALYRDFWRRVHLFPNGNVLAIFEGHALLELDADSELLWVYRGQPHHDLDVAEDGRIYVLTRRAHIVPRIDPDEPVLEDSISILAPDGTELRRVSVLEAFERSEFRSFLERREPHGDILHTNTLEIVDERLEGRLPGVRAGQVLVSCLFLDTIAIIDLDEERVVWAASAGWRWQHQPTVLDSGRMLLFDNLGGDPPGGRSRVLELDPASLEIVWRYEGDAEAPFQTRTCGSAERLPNGNTLITESDNGRAFEVDRAGRIVWEFLNPYRAGPEGRLVATLFEMVRLPEEFPIDWVDADHRSR